VTDDSTTYDVIVIGAGQPGPGVAAARAADGLRVALIEMEQVGGTCLNHGCKPTKALRASATVAHTARRAADYGVHTGDVTVDFGAAIARVHRMIDEMRTSLRSWISGVDNLDFIEGAATLRTDSSGHHQVEVAGRTLTASEVYLNLGNRASSPDIPGLADVPHLTEVELLQLTALPEHLVIVGGGYIGLEFGQMFRRFGSEVTMLVGHGVAAREDEDVAQLVADQLTREGVQILLTRPTAVSKVESGIQVELDDGEPVTGSHLLVATGRRSNSDLLGPDHGIDTDDRGFFVIDDRFQTSVPGVWALGDVNGRGAFTHTAYQDGQILLDPKRSLDGRITTYAMFTDPPLGRVGMTVSEAKKSGRNVQKAEVPMSSVSRAILESETDGLMRILVDADSQEFLGATILGLHADDLIQIIGLAMQAGIRYPTVQQALPIHPTMAEYIPSILGSLQPLD
jgi:pyruvate/2-oxoglutarate dehydrogenase complex dihydrolipoamide dehydrogenase (E3) component